MANPDYQGAYWALSHISEDIKRGAFKASKKGLLKIAELLDEAANRSYTGETKVIVKEHNCQLE